MNKEFEMEIFLGIAIVLAAAGLFYLKFINTPKIEEQKPDPLIEIHNELKQINEDINELMRVRDSQTTATCFSKSCWSSHVSILIYFRSFRHLVIFLSTCVILRKTVYL